MNYFVLFVLSCLTSYFLINITIPLIINLYLIEFQINIIKIKYVNNPSKMFSKKYLKLSFKD